jgi:hypothetical protein
MWWKWEGGMMVYVEQMRGQDRVCEGMARFDDEDRTDRDAFLNRHFADRVMTDTPGVYSLPRGASVTVASDVVRWSGRDVIGLD